MPMHDWTRVEPGIYHDFHTLWLTEVRRELNRGVLPPGYYAMVEQVTASVEADLLALHGGGTARPPLAPGGGVRAVPQEAPAVGLLDRAAGSARKRSRRRVAVRHVSNHAVVAVIELVSPGNKSGRRDFRAFVEKAANILACGVHLLVIDPFPPTARDPHGLHAAIWARVTRPRRGAPPPALPPDRPLTAASYSAGPEVVAAVQPFAVGEPVPAMPLFLEPELYVTVPLEPPYQAAYADVPAVWREVLDA
ncbi:MAG: DUF4058 family protein [Gemmataceae bacterium]